MFHRWLKKTISWEGSERNKKGYGVARSIKISHSSFSLLSLESPCWSKFCMLSIETVCWDPKQYLFKLSSTDFIHEEDQSSIIQNCNTKHYKAYMNVKKISIKFWQDYLMLRGLISPRSYIIPYHENSWFIIRLAYSECVISCPTFDTKNYSH